MSANLLTFISELKTNFETRNGKVLSIEVDTPTFEAIESLLTATTLGYRFFGEPGKMGFRGVSILKRECTCGAYRK